MRQKGKPADSGTGYPVAMSSFMCDSDMAGMNAAAFQLTGAPEVRRAAEQGDAEAQFHLGCMYDAGEYVQQSDAEAMRWWRLAGEQGYAGGQFNLGLMYASGTGVQQSDAEAVRWLRLAAEDRPDAHAEERLARAEAQLHLGAMYTNGSGVSQDDAEAVRWLRLAAEYGHPKAQFHLGAMYINGSGVSQDDAEAVRWLRRAAEQGYAEAQYVVGGTYFEGKGVLKDKAKGMRWLRLAAEQGLLPAKRTLRNLRLKKLKWIVLAAAVVVAVVWIGLAGDAEEQFARGQMYFEGKGVPKDYGEAARSFRLAAAQGHTEAARHLAGMHASGSGVLKSNALALMWFKIAADNGDDDADLILILMESQMPRAEVNLARALARRCMDSDYELCGQ